MPTMLDVAKHAGVALSTVSYAINGTRPISAETRQRIFASMEELGYRPHALARGLASKRSRIIALLFPVSERGFGFTEFEFVTSAADAAHENGYHLVLWPTQMHDPEELRHMTQQGLVDGLILMEVQMHDERVDLLREINFPFSMIGRCADTTGLNYVDINFERTVQEAVGYLCGLGHTHIAFLNQSQEIFDEGYGPAVRTQTRFEQSVAANNLTGVSRFCHANPQAGYEAFNELLSECPHLTALVAMNDRAIPGVMQAIAEHGWQIPADFSIVAIVSSKRMAEMMMPTLTTSDAPTAELGSMGARLLIEQLESQNQATQQVSLPCHLVVRGSSGPCRRIATASI